MSADWHILLGSAHCLERLGNGWPPLPVHRERSSRCSPFSVRVTRSPWQLQAIGHQAA